MWHQWQVEYILIIAHHSQNLAPCLAGHGYKQPELNRVSLRKWQLCTPRASKKGYIQWWSRNIFDKSPKFWATIWKQHCTIRWTAFRAFVLNLICNKSTWKLLLQQWELDEAKLHPRSHYCINSTYRPIPISRMTNRSIVFLNCIGHYTYCRWELKDDVEERRLQ